MPLFRSRNDINFVKRINQELIERVIGERFTYYAISDEYTEDNLYGESKEKIFHPPVSIYGLIEWQDQEPTTTEYGHDVVYKIKIFLSMESLTKINLVPVEGDMIEYDGKKFELLNMTEPVQIFGKSGATMGRTLECRSVRESTFKTSVSGPVEHAQRTRPDDPDVYIRQEVLFAFSASSTL